MGTQFRIKLYAESTRQAREAATAAFARIAELNAILSDYLPDSEVRRLTHAKPGAPIELSATFADVLLNGALAIADQTNGAFDPTVGHYTNLWRRAVRKGILPTPEQLADARKRTGYRKIKIIRSAETASPAIVLDAERMIVDLGGIAKGYAADEALRILNQHGITSAAVAAGGDIRLGDPPPDQPEGWEIPILAMDRDKEKHSAVLRLKNAAVSTSGDREQYVEIDGAQYSHIVDPRTGLGLTNRITATVIAPTAAKSDPLATTLCILGPEKGIPFIEKHPALEALIITRDTTGADTYHYSSGFPR